jgi:cadmium resistance protein CadD (predicted permease)
MMVSVCCEPMGDVAGTVVTAAGLFAGTNIDDMVVLAVLNASSRAAGRPKAWQVWAGQYTGVTVLVVVSLLAAQGLRLVPAGWVWLLGLVPFGLGVRKLILAVRGHLRGQRVSPAVASGLPGVIGVTIANGGDNIAAYTPVFRTLGGGQMWVMLTVFAVGVTVWCLTGTSLVSHKKVTGVIERWGHWIVPAVFMLIGLYVVHKGGIF